MIMTNQSRTPTIRSGFQGKMIFF